jgi:hypothetical protein
MEDQWLKDKVAITEKMAWTALAGGILLAISIWMPAGPVAIAIAVIGALLLMPLLICLCFIPLLHWKRRYRGDHSTLWGALLLFETSGWFKIVYWFRHIRPDLNNTGRYLVPRVDPVNENKVTND